VTIGRSEPRGTSRLLYNACVGLTPIRRSPNLSPKGAWVLETDGFPAGAGHATQRLLGTLLVAPMHHDVMA
jgi:hypothetical protein